jgi:dihydroorotate dehydrogenase electron transfer subunit
MENIKIQQRLFQGTITDNFPLRQAGHQGSYLLQILIKEKVTCHPGHFFKFDLSDRSEGEKLTITESSEEHNILHIKELPKDNDFAHRQPLVARPYSVGLCENNPGETKLTFIYKVVGPGSKKLIELKPGKTITVLGPLGGNGFYLPKNKTRALMVAGGVGLPPLVFLSKELLEKNIHSIHLFIGATSQEKLPLPAELEGRKIKGPDSLPRMFQVLADPRVTVRVSTDDGSEGFRGFSPQLLADHLTNAPDLQNTAVYTCGPWKMMASTAQIAQENKLPCQACLEEMMGCGIGACQSCVTRIKSTGTGDKGWEYKLVCRDGPVFDTSEILWEKE